MIGYGGSCADRSRRVYAHLGNDVP
jgi:hypothetical protein